MKHLVLPCVLLPLFACRAALPEEGAGEMHALPALPDGERIGMPIEAGEIHSLAEVSASPADYFEKTLLVEARVAAVCQNAGCWMKIEDDAYDAMVRWEDGCGGRFAFPTSAVGRRVVIQGSFYPKAISEEDAAHLEGEAGPDVTIPREGYELNASAILVRADA